MYKITKYLHILLMAHFYMIFYICQSAPGKGMNIVGSPRILKGGGGLKS